MTPREIAEVLVNTVYRHAVAMHESIVTGKGAIGWKDGDVLAAVDEAIDSATKALREENGALQTKCTEAFDEKVRLEHARPQAESANRALVEALEAAGEIIHSEFCSEKNHPQCMTVTTALAAKEKRNKAE